MEFKFGRPGEDEKASAERLETYAQINLHTSCCHSLTPLNSMQDAVRTLLTCLGEDPTRPGLVDTPKRVAKALEFMTHGYTTVCWLI